MKTAWFAALLGLLLAARAFAGEGKSPEDRFHETYVMEVVEGKVSEAAKSYLALTEEEGTPPRIRREATFRFAICAVLLGRPDEARAKLADLVRDPETPTALRDRAAEYARSIEGVGVGSELDRKLESLVFDLGRVEVPRVREDPDPPPVYRDFEIIGAAAVPFLRKLLAHADLSIRRHAWRILVRMDVDGAVDAWTPEIGLWREGAIDLDARLGHRPDELPAVEEKLLSLPDDRLEAISPHLTRFRRLSERFLRAIAARLGPPAVGLLQRVAPDDAAPALLAEWVRGDREDLAREAAVALLRRPELPPADLFPIMVRLGSPSPADLGRFASTLPPAVVLAALGTTRDPNILEALAGPLDFRLQDPGVAREYRDLLLTWKPLRPPHLGAVLAALPVEEAEALAVTLAADSGLLRNGLLAEVGRRGDLRIVAAALRAATPADRTAILRSLAFLQNPPVDSTPVAEIRRRLEFFPEALAWVEEGYRPSYWGLMLSHLRFLPPEEAAGLLVRLTEPWAEQIRRGRAWPMAWMARPEYAPFVSRALEPLSLLLLPEAGPDLVQVPLELFKGKTPLGEEDRARLGEFLLAHLEFVPSGRWVEIASAPDLMAFETWVPRTPADARVGRFVPPVDRERADRAARTMTEPLENANEAVFAFVADATSPEVRRSLADKVIGLVPLAELRAAHSRLGEYADPEIVRSRLEEALSASALDLDLVAALANDLAGRHPTELLLVAARQCLGAERRELTEFGIGLAKRLGRKALLPDLATILDSLDAGIREKARDAMDSILELERLRGK